MNNKKRLWVILAAVAIIASGTLYTIYQRRSTPVMIIQAGNTTGAVQAGHAEEGSGTEPPPVPMVTVHIVGEVMNPGIYAVAEGSRVADVLERAGGATAEANLHVNLARLVHDGEQIVIPKIGEEIPVPESVTAGAGIGSGLVNINTASADELMTLSGVGPATAQNIIVFRETHGPFERIEDLLRVTRIGERTFEGLKDFITIG